MLRIIVFTLSLVFFSNCWTTVKGGEVGVLWKPWNEGLVQQPVPSGVHLLFPWNDIFIYSTQWSSHIETVDVLTQDDLKIDVTAVIIMRPLYAEIFTLQKEIGPDYYKKLVKAEFRASVRNAAAKYQMIQISKNAPVIANDIKNAVNERIKQKHLEISNVVIDDVVYSKTMLDAIERKLSKQQELEQMKYELSISEKNIQIAKLQAQADAEAAIIRAEGQAKSQSIIDKNLTTKYLQYKAFDNANAKFFYIPTGKSNLPIIVNSDKEN